MTQRMFPMQKGPPIPWETAKVIYRAYSRLYGTQQSLERLGERGGFGWAEVPVIFKELERRYPALWRELMRDRPTVSLPDDHDVYQGNLWGESGEGRKTTQAAGGYDMAGDRGAGRRAGDCGA